jgi:hypothetical protein
VGLGIELAFIFLNYELSLQYSVSFTVKEWKCASLWCYTKRIIASAYHINNEQLLFYANCCIFSGLLGLTIAVIQ